MHSHVLYSYLIKCGLKFISCLQVHKLPETSHTNYTHPCDSLTNLQLKLWPQTVELTPSCAEVTNGNSECNFSWKCNHVNVTAVERL